MIKLNGLFTSHMKNGGTLNWVVCCFKMNVGFHRTPIGITEYVEQVDTQLQSIELRCF